MSLNKALALSLENNWAVGEFTSSFELRTHRLNQLSLNTWNRADLFRTGGGEGVVVVRLFLSVPLPY